MTDALIAAHLGLPHEPAGIVLVERLETLTDEFDRKRGRWKTDVRYAVQQIERPEAGTRLQDVAQAVGDVAPLGARRTTLLVNVTNCGRPAIDLMTARQMKPIPIVTTNSDVARRGKGSIHVPLKELTTNLAILLGERRISPFKGLSGDALLGDQLREFRSKPPPKSAREPLREDETGELVMALALACWWGETRLSSLVKQPPVPKLPIKPDPPLTFDMALKLSGRERMKKRARI